MGALSLCKLTLLRNPCRLQVNSPWPSCFVLPPLHICFANPQLARMQWERAVEVAERAGCKLWSRSRLREERLASAGRYEEARHPYWFQDKKCAQFCTRFNWCPNYLQVNLSFGLPAVTRDPLSSACSRRKLQSNSRNITEWFRSVFLISERLPIASSGSQANTKAFGWFSAVSKFCLPEETGEDVSYGQYLCKQEQEK